MAENEHRVFVGWEGGGFINSLSDDFQSELGRMIDQLGLPNVVELRDNNDWEVLDPPKRVELSLEDKVAFGEQWVDKVVELVKKSLAQLLPKYNFAVEVENRGSEELQVVLPQAGFSLDLIEIERRCIGRIRVQPGWQLTGYKTHPASRWHPEEIEDVPISEHYGHWEAVGALIKAIHADEVDGWLGAEGEAQWLEENKDWPDLTGGCAEV